MIRAKKDDKALVADILCNSFKINKSVNYIVKNDKKKFKRIRSLMNYSFNVCSMFGDVWLSDDRKACALLIYPHKKRTTPASIWLDIKLIFSVIGLNRVKKALEREAAIKTKQTKIPMAYLWFIGVNSIYQSNGIGSRLLQEVIAYADKTGLPVFIETSTIENLPWYKNFGFKVYDTLNLSYDLYFMKRTMH